MVESWFCPHDPIEQECEYRFTEYEYRFTEYEYRFTEYEYDWPDEIFFVGGAVEAPRDAMEFSGAAGASEWGSGCELRRFPDVWVFRKEGFPTVDPSHPLDRWLIEPKPMGNGAACDGSPLVVSNPILIVSKSRRDATQSLH
jgi:hypothetical protein